jgi:hypothetical protein
MAIAELAGDLQILQSAPNPNEYKVICAIRRLKRPGAV